MKIECMSAYLQNILGLRKLITLMMTTMTMVIMLVMSVTTRVNLDNFDDAEVDDGR